MSDRVIAAMPLLLGLFLAARSDLRTGRIPNRVTITLACLGLFRAAVASFNAPSGGLMFAASMGMLIGLGLTIVFYSIGAMGAGDVKLMAAIGAWLGPAGILTVFAVTALLGMVMAVLQCAAQGKVVALARNSTVALCNLMYVGPNKLKALRDAREDCPSVGPPIPFAFPALGAALLTICLGAVA